ncbi:quercetin 2,3-dioxygenase [Lampropedia cohaerens]|uniref:Quercetin 2,3-dioxygenase n=1 Tax=Lampropedia cohaerens TaxID=1610491 RepID=A0A0U1Q0A5_9BURK|nr:pirin family protein [Lampropedia cohaerens]KKW68204.1 quercetin 2,3-dioxygenase [Lampropedia cohaerens]
MKTIDRVFDAPRGHWVGDGFPVRTMFSYHSAPERFSPFLLLDYAGPTRFAPTNLRRGVGQHPHRGFETVTIIYEGEVEHHDSTGAGGQIGPGDVQWMTAGAGILHEEYHSDHYAAHGGPFEMIQLWVNLPAAAKRTPPGYQSLMADAIPQVMLPGNAGRVRVIAGAFDGARGPAHTHSPMQVWDVARNSAGMATLPAAQGWTTLLLVRRGTVLVNDSEVVRDAQLVSLTREGQDVRIEANGDAQLLFLSGAPIDEPNAGYGPFVMNTQAEIRESIADFNAGRFASTSEG